jgi:hypothetical protein
LIFPGLAGRLALSTFNLWGRSPHKPGGQEMSEFSLTDPYMDRAILYAGFSSAIKLLYAIYTQRQKGGPLTLDQQQQAFDLGEQFFHEALERAKQDLPKKPDLFQR